MSNIDGIFSEYYSLVNSRHDPETIKDLNQDTLVPGQDTGAGIDVDGGVGKAIQQELLVDDVLTCRKCFVSISASQ